MAVKVYGSEISTCVQRVLIICNELGVKYEMTNIDLMKGEQKHPDWIENKHPFGAVPVFVASKSRNAPRKSRALNYERMADEDGTQLFESRAIARYLVAKYGPNSGLLPSPSDPKAYGLFEQAASIEYSSFDPPASYMYSEYIWAQIQSRDVNTELVEKHRKTLLTKLEGYERILSKQKYLAGDNLTLADLFHIPYGAVVEKLQPGILSSQPNVKRWWEELIARDSWKALTDKFARTHIL